MRLIIIRHAETEDNKLNVFSQNDASLSPVGIIQAKKLARRLDKEKIDVIYSSDLRRCEQTVKPFLAMKKVPVHYTKELREINWGIFKGKPLADFISWRKAHFDENDLSHSIPQGESFMDVRKRIMRLLSYILRKEKGKNVLIVTHNGPIREILLYLLKKDHATHYRKFKPGSTALSIINVKDDGTCKARLINSVKHLEES